MVDRSLDDLHPDLKLIAEAWLAKCHRQSINAVIYFTWRSISEQNELYAIGRTKPGKIVTNARGGQSFHNFTINGQPASKAFDWFIQNPDGTANWDINSIEWKTAVVYGKDMGLQYGGDWPGVLHDLDHFQID